MLGIGIGEMVLIGIIALVVIGPEKFPDFAKIAIRTVRDLRGYVDDIQTEITKELKPVKQEFNQLKKYDPEKYIDSIMKETPKASVGSSSAASSNQSSSAAADPTDRQETTAAPTASPYDNAAGPAEASDSASTPESSTTEDAVAPEPDADTAETTETASQEDNAFDFSNPPPERMD